MMFLSSDVLGNAQGIFAILVLLCLSAHRQARNIWFSVTATANEIAGAAVGLLTVGGAALAGWRALRKRRQERRRQDDENRDLLLGLPKVITDISSTMGQMQQELGQLKAQIGQTGDRIGRVDAGVHALNASITLMGMTVESLSADVSYVKTRRELELEEEGVCWFEAAADGKWKKCGQALCDLFGLTTDQMLKDGTGWLQAVDGNSSVAWERFTGSITDGIPYRDRFTIHNRKTGQRAIVESYAQRIEDAMGKTIKFYGRVSKIEGGV